MEYIGPIRREKYMKNEKKRKKLFLVLKILLAMVLTVVLVVAGYFAYVFISYHREPDNLEQTVKGNASLKAETGREYTIVTMNVGFGAYTPDFTFFMDGGKNGRAESEESVIACTYGASDTVLGFLPDIVLLQEVDTDSDRSHHVDQTKLINERFAEKGNYDSSFAINWDSPYMFLPLIRPHGVARTGLYTLSAFDITSSLRRSLPVSTGFSKIIDLDRCYSVNRIPVENGKELVIINTHLSAYGTDDAQGNAQLEMIYADMKAEYEKGNYVICGGDFNHDFTGNSTEKFNPGVKVDISWCHPMPTDITPKCLSLCTDYEDGGKVPSARNADIPYSEKSVTVIVDGFIISDNITCNYLQIEDCGFEYSDHNPVVMRFELKP